MVAPAQPMSNTAQANLRGMRDEVLSWNETYPPYMADKSINNALRKVFDRRMWGGLLVQDQIITPDAVTAGSVDLTRGSRIIVGTSTAWPTNDLVDTTPSVAIAETGLLIDVTPVSMAGIGLGDWLTVAGGTGSEEQVLVVGTTEETFRAKFRSTHTTTATIWKSSLARLQFRVVESAPWYSVVGVSSPTQLKIDNEWGGTDLSGQSYAIFQGYVTFNNDCKMVVEVANLNRRYRVALHMPQAAVNAYDPQRSATESTYMLLDLTPDEIGRPRYEWYPRPMSAQVFSVIYYRTTSVLEDDEDTPPPFIRSDVLVSHAVADALRYKPKNNPFYDPGSAARAAQDKMIEFERGIVDMAQADDSVYMTNLRWRYSQWPLGSYGADWMQSHDIGSDAW